MPHSILSGLSVLRTLIDETRDCKLRSSSEHDVPGVADPAN